MKRNSETNRKNRLKTAARYMAGGGNSRYAQKVKRGNMMYGTGRRIDGCCAHRIKLAQHGGMHSE